MPAISRVTDGRAGSRDMTRAELAELIANGENSAVEFKEENVHPGVLAEEVVAFANVSGGVILLGVRDDGTVSGVSRPDIEEWVMNICSHNVVPEIIPEFYRVVTEDGRVVVALRIPRGTNRPYRTNQGKYLVRVGTTKRIVSQMELARLFQASGMLHFDITPVPTASFDDLDIDKIQAYFMHLHKLDVAAQPERARLNILVNADIVRWLEGETRHVPTVGGLLLFGKRPEDRLPASGVTFARFDGVRVTDPLIDKRQIGGTLPEVVEATVAALEAHLPRVMGLNGLRRVAGLPYPREVLREALVNAVVHRDYSIAGSKVRVFLFSDRIEVRSPGRLPNTVTVEKMKVGTSFARNPMLLRYMENLDYVDRLGLGIPMIIERMLQASGREPDLVEKGEEFWLVLYGPCASESASLTPPVEHC
ncbi:MAG: ATP-binding protein [Bacillota bacterium]|nr:ATP-binding protein [Bacillota bacterium]